MDFRFRGKSGHATEIAPRTDFDPEADIGRIEIPQRSSLLHRFAQKHGGTGSEPPRFHRAARRRGRVDSGVPRRE
jgi:hypothetical protein